jgi:hypothetical protein
MVDWALERNVTNLEHAIYDILVIICNYDLNNVSQIRKNK